MQHRTFHVGLIAWFRGRNDNGKQNILQLCKVEAFMNSMLQDHTMYLFQVVVRLRIFSNGKSIFMCISNIFTHVLKITHI